MGRRKKIAIQGVRGCFHEQAAVKHFGENIEFLECSTFEKLVEALKSDKVDYAVMAIENTLAGSLLTNYTLIRDNYLKIVGEVYLHIQMNLMVNKGVKLEAIKKVFSHPIALRQCKDYLSTIPQARVIEAEDTAESAKIIKENGSLDTAAIASIEAAKIYGLEVLDKSIETNKKNYTRFMVLSNEGVEEETNTKASLCFELGHQPGLLMKVLKVFADRQINLTKIQSVPIVGRPYEYTFHVDLLWNNYSDYESAIKNLVKVASHLTILGEYPKGDFNVN